MNNTDNGNTFGSNPEIDITKGMASSAPPEKPQTITPANTSTTGSK
jgi:hypothetical protein